MLLAFVIPATLYPLSRRAAADAAAAAAAAAAAETLPKTEFDDVDISALVPFYSLSSSPSASAVELATAAAEPIFLPTWIVAGTLGQPSKGEGERPGAGEEGVEEEEGRPKSDGLLSVSGGGSGTSGKGGFSFVRGVLVFGVAMAFLALLDTIVIDAHIDTTNWV